ncbi:MAG TPA: sialidase family protein, partial [Chloroflexota bacterium]|nr:sialidase family protein [Chloroflexota bacterium]
WTDSVLPTSFTRGTAFGGLPREYWQAHGDASVAWDSRGNAYIACQVFDRGGAVSPNPDESSAIYVYRSTQTNGASWNFPGKPVSEQALTNGSPSSLPLIDKPYMTVDNNTGSPYRDRVYVTWTLFSADGTGYLWEANSADYGQSFGAPVLVSTTSDLCPNNFGLPTPNGKCNENQFSQPFTAADGTLYVVYDNFNNALSGPLDNHNQVLLVKSTDGGATFSAPVKVADWYDLPDCARYQNGADPGRACVPEKGSTANSIFRATNYPSAAVNPTKSGQIAVTFGSYINENSNRENGCTPNGIDPSFGTNLYKGVKTPGACNNDIVLSVSNDGGATFTGTNADVRDLPTVTSAPGQGTTDQFWQWAAFTSNGTLAVSYFDRQYGSDENTGFSDVSLSGSRDLKHFAVQRVTNRSLPPPSQFGGVFYGDYTGLAVGGDAHPVWQDTRNPELFVCPGTGTPGVPPTICTEPASNAKVANDQDIFTTSVPVPVP